MDRMTENELVEMIRRQWNLNVISIFHHSAPSEKKFYIIRQFTPSSSLVPYHDLRGQDISKYISQDFFSQQLADWNGIASTTGKILKASSFDRIIDEIPIGHYQFSNDFSYELYLSE